LAKNVFQRVHNEILAVTLRARPEPTAVNTFA
jgi:hypothetical protein